MGRLLSEKQHCHQEELSETDGSAEEICMIKNCRMSDEMEAKTKWHGLANQPTKEKSNKEGSWGEMRERLGSPAELQGQTEKRKTPESNLEQNKRRAMKREGWLEEAAAAPAWHRRSSSTFIRSITIIWISYTKYTTKSCAEGQKELARITTEICCSDRHFE